MAAEKKKPTDRGRFVKWHLEHGKLDVIGKAIGRKDHGRGIYILYDGKQVYYIGLSHVSLRSRLKDHATRDRHKGKWDNFSFYQIRNPRCIKDLESLLLGVYRPPGNRQKGRLKKKYDMRRKIML